MTRRTLLALGALLIPATLLVHGAEAGPAVSDMRGSYFGHFTSNSGNTLYSDINITLQVKKVFSGSFNMGGVLQSVLFTGKCKPGGGFTVKGVVGQGDVRTRIKLDGAFHPGGNGQLAILQGTYRMTGDRKETGTFSFSGASNL